MQEFIKKGSVESKKNSLTKTPEISSEMSSYFYKIIKIIELNSDAIHLKLQDFFYRKLWINFTDIIIK